MAKYIDVRNSGGELVILGDALVLPASDLASTPSPGAIRFNPSSGVIECYNDGAWSQIGTGSGGGAPTEHTHTIAQVLNLQSTLDGKAAKVHNHAISEITGLQAALDSAGSGGGGTGGPIEISDVIGLTDALLEKASFAHGHTITDISDLQNSLDGKANLLHIHSVQDITGLQTTLSDLQNQINNIEAGGGDGGGDPTDPTNPGDPSGDVTPPAVVGGLTLTSSIDPATQKVTLTASWSASLAADLVGYILSIKEGTGNFVEFLAGPTATHYYWDVKANTTYTVNIRAYDRAGNRSILSADVVHTTTRDTVAPGRPTSPAALASFKSIFLSWTNPIAADLTHAEIWENTVNNTGTATKIATINAKSGEEGRFTRSGLETNKLMWYWIKAVDSSGNASPFSTAVQATTAFVEVDELLGQIVAEQIADDAITTAKFAQGITAVEIVSALPTTGNFDGRLVFRTTDGKMFRYTGGAFTAAVSAVDIDGTITSTQIANDAITTPKIAAGAITANEIASQTITAQQIAANSITAGVIAAGAIGATEIAAGSVIAGKIAAGAVSTNELAANAVTAAKIKAGTITANEIAAGTIKGTNIAAGTILADNILGGTITGDKFNTGTSLPGTIKVGSTGVSIGTMQTQAALGAQDPASRINQGSTIINGGKVDVFGNTTLSSWRFGGDNTSINGGAIAANTITANKLRIGQRGITILGLEFEWVPNTNTVRWSAGQIYYEDDNGSVASKAIPAGSITATAHRFFYWVKDSTTVSHTQSAATARGVNNVHLASWWGGANLVVNYGGTIINGENITTGSIAADRLNVNKLSAISGTIGRLASAETGARVIITDSLIEVFDSLNRRRVRLGLW